MKKRDLQMLLIVLGVILVLVFLIGLLFKTLNLSMNQDRDGLIIDTEISTEKSDISDEDREKINKYNLYMENEYTKSLTVEQRKVIIDFIDDVTEAINVKDYAHLYSKLNYLYADAFFPTQEKFAEHLAAITYGATDYTCTQYNVKYYGYECVLTSESQGTKIEIQIKAIENYTNYELALRKDLISVAERNAVFYVNGLSGIIKYEVKCANTLEYNGVLISTEKNDVTCDFSESVAISNSAGTLVEYKLQSPNTEFIIPKDSSKDITFVFNISSTDTKRPKYLDLSCKIGEKTKITTVNVDSSDDGIEP